MVQFHSLLRMLQVGKGCYLSLNLIVRINDLTGKLRSVLPQEDMPLEVHVFKPCFSCSPTIGSSGFNGPIKPANSTIHLVHHNSVPHNRSFHLGSIRIHNYGCLDNHSICRWFSIFKNSKVTIHPNIPADENR